MPWAIYLVLFTVVTAVALSAIPKTPEPKPASLEDFSVPTAEPGRPVPVVFGTVTVTGPNVVWYGDLGRKAIKTKSGK